MNNRCRNCRFMYPRKGCNNPDVQRERPAWAYHGWVQVSENERYHKTNCTHFEIVEVQRRK